jgi:hypothetical protein
MQDVLLAYEKPKKVLPSPKYRLGGHKGEVGMFSQHFKKDFFKLIFSSPTCVSKNIMGTKMSELLSAH